MPTPGFPPHTLDAEGLPVWIRDLASSIGNHSLHVVRGLEPGRALEALGVLAGSVRPGELPAGRPDELTSLPAAALGADAGEGATLLAGRVGEWTFVYDDSGYTFDGTAEALSGDGRTAVTTVHTVNGHADLTYAVDGEEVETIVPEDFDPAEDLPHLPAELRTAFEAAGVAEWDDLEPGRPDTLVGMRAACALAGLALTLDDIRRLPLLLARRTEGD
ncbi:hypothetical protein [Streptomyces sp. NPDC093970]|uniref:DUF6461 domain-containing protein n=1 Tax=Streptomyces sp. NPDC093970 TaxID=3155076 RepID=UPI00342A3D0E